MATGDITINGVIFTPDDLEKITGEVSNRLKSTSKDPGQYEQVDNLEGVTSIPVFKQSGNTYKLVRVLTSILKGTDGKEIYLQNTDTHLQWRREGGEWNNLVSLADIAGKKGSSPEFRTTDEALEWKYDTDADDKWRQFLPFDQFKTPVNELTELVNIQKNQVDTLSKRMDRHTVEIDTIGAGIDSLINEIDAFKEELNIVSVNKADGAIVEDGYLYLTSNGEIVSNGIELPAGGGNGSGGSGGGSTLRLINRGDASVGIPKGQPVVLKYTFSSLDYETQESTGNGTAVYYVNNARVYTQSIAQGDVDFDITNYMSDGQNQIRIQVTDSYGAIRSLNMRVEVINLQVTSTFDDSLAYEGEVQFPFTPIGSGSKTIRFILDGQELEPVTTTASNRQMYKRINGLSHGSHSLEVFATMEAQGITITSDSLHYSIIYLEAGTGQVIISSSFHQAEATQYEVLAIPYSVYHPTASTTAVQLKANGEVVSNLVIDRTPQVWSYRIPGHGQLELEIVSGNASQTFNLTVAKSDIDSDAETEKLELYLTSNGRSNYEENPSEWKFGDVSATLKGFNFKTNGWVLDQNNVTTLRISQGARVEIPFRPFFSDFKSTGKTIEIEFKVSNVQDFKTDILSCFSGDRGFKATPNEILFKSALSSVSARFKENEMVRISFVIESRLKNRIIYIYINGIASGAIQYVSEDTFEQVPPVGITFGSDHCTIDVYNIRSYGMDLNAFQILNNYIADTADVKKKLAVYDRNQVFDPSGEIQYNLLVNFLPVMTIVGQLPTFKSTTPEEKKINDIYFENRQHPELSFVTYGAENDVQGTSSQLYPRKNFKWKIKNGITLTESGVKSDKYALRGTDIPVNAFCMKADFVESSGTHNTGIAKYFDQVLRSLNYLTPPQKVDERIRTTVDGYPCAIFHKETDDSPMIFIGKYNFNNDKGTQQTYGFDGKAECWEFLNNTSDNCLFKASDFTSTIWDPNKEKNVPVWTNDFEARYAENENNPDTSNLQKLTSWVVSCIGNPEKFRSECAGHFNLDNLLSYYLLTEFIGATDQRAKNMMMASWGNEGSGDYKYYFIFYDNDTVLGINNEGVNAFNYDIEYQDIVGGGYVWNGWGSELWKLVKDAFTIELADMYRAMRSSALTYNKAIKILNEGQAAYWSEVVYNTDGYYKYIAPIHEESGNASYLYALQGSRTDHRVWWLSNRFMYMDSKYNAGDFRDDFISFRTYAPQNGDQLPVKPNADFKLTLLKDSYLQVVYASKYVVKERGKANQTIEIKAPSLQTYNDTETAVYGISTIKSLGSLASFYPGTVDISRARSLTELVIGSSIEGYENKKLTHITTGNNRMLRLVDIQNCPNYTESLNLKGCNNIEEVYAKGSNTSMVTLPQAGVLKILSLPASINNLTLRNQPELTDEGLQLESVDNISTLVLENMNSIDQLALVKKILDSEPRKLNRVRLIGVDVSDEDLSILHQLVILGGIDESGQNIEKPMITGKWKVEKAGETELKYFKEIFPELDITYNTFIEDPYAIIEFISSQSQPLLNAKFEASFPYEKIGETSYKIKAPKGSEINLMFVVDNHLPYVKPYTIERNITVRFAVKYIPLRTVVIKSSSYGNPIIPGATVVVNEKEKYISDNNGKVFIRKAGEFTVTCLEDSYGERVLNISESLTDDVIDIVLYPYVTYRQEIKSDVFGHLLQGAILEIDGRKILSDDSGIVSLRLTRGTYEWSAYYGKNKKTTGSVYISQNDVFQQTTVAISKEDIKPAQNGSIQVHARIMGSHVLSYLNITMNNDKSFYVDWGDGTYENIDPNSITNFSIDKEFSISHRYEGGCKIYLIQVSGNTGITRFVQKLRAENGAFWSIGNTQIKNMSFNYSLYAFIGNDVFKNDGARENFSSVMENNYSLKEIEAGTFDGLTNAKYMKKLFSGTSAKSLPKGIFRDKQYLLDLSHVLASFSGYLDPEDTEAFIDCKKVHNWSNSFNGKALAKFKRIKKGFLPDLEVNYTTITDNMFWQQPLKSIYIPSGFNCIGTNFVCLTSAYSIENENFTTVMEYLEFESVIPPILYADSFPSIDQWQQIGTKIYVPDIAVNEYKQATNWSIWADVILPVSQKPVDKD